MKKIGISIYPEKSNFEQDSLYITKAASLGYSRLFISLLEIKGDQDEILKNFRDIILFAKSKGLQVILDVNPAIFKDLGISYSDLAFFSKLGADGIRLDLGFSGSEEALMTHNPYDLLIEINMSHGTEYLENIISRGPRSGYLIGSHNFYPHEFTGLDLEFFTYCNEKFKKQNIPTAAFINAPSGTYGPWPMAEGICTVEEHRHLSVFTQAAHLLFSNMIDCVIFGNAYASDEELECLANIAKMQSIPIRVAFDSSATDLEREIVLNSTHIYRGERSSYVYRTKSDGRKKYANQPIPANNTVAIEKGSVTIDNDLYLQYKGELQIAKQARLSNEKVNVVGKVVREDFLLLETLKRWSSFHFEEI